MNTENQNPQEMPAETAAVSPEIADTTAGTAPEAPETAEPAAETERPHKRHWVREPLEKLPMHLDGVEEFAYGKTDPFGFFWSVDEEGFMTINGMGATEDYSLGKYQAPPWEEYKPYIRIIFVEDGITELGIRAFKDCPNLESVSLPASLTRIHYECFDNCPKLRELELAEGVQLLHINDAADWQPHTVTMGLHAFRGSIYAKEHLGEFYTLNGVLVDYLGSDTDVTVPEGIREIGRQAFADSKLKAVHLPQSLRKINMHAFYRTQLQRVEIPALTEVIETRAFSDCPKLEQVLLPAGERLLVQKEAFFRTRCEALDKDTSKFQPFYKMSAKKLRGMDDFDLLEVQETGRSIGTAEVKLGKSVLAWLKRRLPVIGLEYSADGNTLCAAAVYRYLPAAGEKYDADEFSISAARFNIAKEGGSVAVNPADEQEFSENSFIRHADENRKALWFIARGTNTEADGIKPLAAKFLTATSR